MDQKLTVYSQFHIIDDKCRKQDSDWKSRPVTPLSIEKRSITYTA